MSDTPDLFEFEPKSIDIDKTRRPRCVICGRFLRSSSVRTVGSIDCRSDDYYQTGHCSTHGPVEVIWERP